MSKPAGSLAPLAIAAVAVGGLAIVIGNVQMATGSPVGYGVRGLGLAICILTGLLFLVARTGARIQAGRRKRTSWPAATGTRITQTGPSPALVAFIRAFCLVLFFLGIFSLITSLSAFIMNAFGRARGMPIGSYLVYMLFQPALLVVSSILIWFMTDTVRRISEQLDEVTYRVAKLQRDAETRGAVDGVQAGDVSEGAS